MNIKKRKSKTNERDNADNKNSSIVNKSNKKEKKIDNNTPEKSLTNRRESKIRRGDEYYTVYWE